MAKIKIMSFIDFKNVLHTINPVFIFILDFQIQKTNIGIRKIDSFF